MKNKQNILTKITPRNGEIIVVNYDTIAEYAYDGENNMLLNIWSEREKCFLNNKILDGEVLTYPTEEQRTLYLVRVRRELSRYLTGAHK